MKRKKFLKYLLSLGIVLHREGGNHSVFINPIAKRISTVPRHNEINDFLINKICRDLDIPAPTKR